MGKINPCYLVFNILVGIVLFIYLRKKSVDKKILFGLMSGYIVFSVGSFSYLNGIVEHIFKLQFLSVKSYLILVVLVNLIMLFTLNRNMNPIYRGCNYILFIVMMIIFGSTMAVLLGNRFKNLYVMDVSNAVNFIDLSFVIFLLYLILMSLIFIGIEMLGKKNIDRQEFAGREIFSYFKEFGEFRKKILKFRKKRSSKKAVLEKMLTEEELKNFDRSEPLYIHGVLCNIIFEDSCWENVVRNYQILNEDIQARMVNGYTLEENLMLKNICMKLQVPNLTFIDIHNFSLLNKISVDEYQLLMRIIGVN